MGNAFVRTTLPMMAAAAKQGEAWIGPGAVQFYPNQTTLEVFEATDADKDLHSVSSIDDAVQVVKDAQKL